MNEPTFAMREDGDLDLTHECIRWEHDGPGPTDRHSEPMTLTQDIPIVGSVASQRRVEQGWPRKVEWDLISAEPLTVHPSIHCVPPEGCGLHGWIRDGRWVPA